MDADSAIAGTGAVRHPLMTAFQRIMKQPQFVAAAVVLLIAAIGLNAAVTALQLHFKKMPVPLARDLHEIAPSFGDWVQVSRDEPLQHDVQEVLNTDKYVFRDYVNVAQDSGACGLALLVYLHKDDPQQKLDDLRSAYMTKSTADRQAMLVGELKDKTTDERKEALYHVQEQYPNAVINMAVTYYTGLVDTVAHIPDRCYIADGFEPTDYEVPTWTLASGQALTVRFINFQDSSGTARIDRSVAYFFQVNGRWESDPLGVRRSLQNLLEKYGYYAKVELMTLDPDHQESATTMTQFLSAAMPEVQKCMPNWAAVTGNAAVAGKAQ
jgi:Protein of unknown function (DUF3485)